MRMYWVNSFKFGTRLCLESRMNWLQFGGPKSRSLWSHLNSILENRTALRGFLHIWCLVSMNWHNVAACTFCNVLMGKKKLHYSRPPTTCLICVCIQQKLLPPKLLLSSINTFVSLTNHNELQLTALFIFVWFLDIPFEKTVMSSYCHFLMCLPALVCALTQCELVQHEIGSRRNCRVHLSGSWPLLMAGGTCNVATIQG